MVVFFVAALLAGITSLINLFEAPTATLQEKLHLGRGQAVAVIGLMGLAVGLSIQGIVSGWMDVCSIYACPVGALLAGVFFFWVYDREECLRQVNPGPGKTSGPVVLSHGQIRVLRRDGAGADPGRCERRHRLRCGNFSERSPTPWRRGNRWSW